MKQHEYYTYLKKSLTEIKYFISIGNRSIAIEKCDELLDILNKSFISNIDADDVKDLKEYGEYLTNIHNYIIQNTPLKVIIMGILENREIDNSIIVGEMNAKDICNNIHNLLTNTTSVRELFLKEFLLSIIDDLIS